MGTLTPAISAMTAFTGSGAAMAAPHILAATEIGKTLIGQNDAQKAVKQQQADQELALKQLQQTQNAELSALQQQIALEKEQIAADAAETESERLSALKRAVARQKAVFGGSGVGNQSSGSSEAVLLGLFSESEDEKASREKLDNLRYTALDQDVANQNRVNVLQRAQLAEQQRIERASWF